MNTWKEKIKVGDYIVPSHAKDTGLIVGAPYSVEGLYPEGVALADTPGGPACFVFPYRWLDNGWGKHSSNVPVVSESLNTLCDKIHATNLAAGWWKDLGTGEDMRNSIYFQSTKLLLCHAEISEAVEALRKGQMDDKLPQYAGEAVELVDALIRIFDYMGMKGYDVEAILADKLKFNTERADHKQENRSRVGGKLF